MTNDSRKGWKYKLRTDKNQRERRRPEVRARVREFKDRAAPTCSSRSGTPHGGELEVHHVGGIKRNQRSQRLAYMCEDHNRADAGQRPHGARPDARIRARAARSSPLVWWALGAAGAAAWLFL